MARHAVSARPPAWTAADAERWLLGRELFGMRFGLERMRELLAALGDPQERFASVHVVGTNGKSSTVRMTAAILRRHGLRVGAYLSPHLVSFAERIRVDDADLAPERLAACVERVARVAERLDAGDDDHVTQFEALTAAALSELAEQRVDAAVIEAGLGGRLDATNVLPSRVQVLTNVGLEHTRWLGSTVREIATEKLDVVRPGGTLVLGPDPAPDALDVARRVAAERGATLLVAPLAPAEPYAALLPAYQRRNFAVAIAAARAFLGELDEGAVADAAAHAAVPGRLQVVDEQLVLDGAHNAAGLEALAQALPELAGERPVVGVVSILDDKDTEAMLRTLLEACEQIVFCRIANPRALSPAALASLAVELGAPRGSVHIEDGARAAVDLARTLAGPDGIVLATGSFYLLADLLRPAGAEPGATL
ncbi:MAG TPA: cyanophycin synthetase [Solirubrobacteraceae bacterium]|nr:cyanophycin synthetase [Solirubrobacteraceae bacterium]